MHSVVAPDLAKSYKAESVNKSDSHLSYRPDIDGLRAIAILSVVIFHAFPFVLTGGFVGVDVFFVISGYLISSIIMKGVAAGNFSFYNFYMRRVRRIFPALMLVLAATFSAGWILMMGEEFKSLSKHIIAGISFVQNLILYTESGYFDVSAETKPLLHLWSLGVEEQFYLIFPVILILLHRLKLSLLPALLLMAIISFVLSVLYIADTPAGVFFLPQYRFWELLFGSLLAFVSLNTTGYVAATQSGLIRNSISALGILLITIAVVLIDKTRQFPGYWALLPVLGSTLIIYAGPDAWINKSILASRFMVVVGLISYPLYLWHWPLFSFAYIYFSGAPTVSVQLAMVFLAFLLAFLTYKFVELPLRQKVSNNKAFAALIAIAISFIVVSAVVFDKNGLPERQDERREFAEYFSNARPDWHYFTENKIPERFRYDCDWFNSEAFFNGKPTFVPVPSVSEKCFKSTASKKILFWGDSHAQQFIYGVSHELPTDVGILVATSSGCTPNLPEVDRSSAEYCRQSNNFAMQTIKNQKPDVVVIGQLAGHDIQNSFSQIVAALTSYGVKHVIFVGPVPQWESNLNQIILRKYWESTPSYITDSFVKSVNDSDAILKSKYGNGQGPLQYISMIELLCGDEGCRTFIGSDRKIGLTTFDNAHLTPATSIYAAQTTLVPLILKDLESTK